jgi:hypothetical protein
MFKRFFKRIFSFCAIPICCSLFQFGDSTAKNQQRQYPPALQLFQSVDIFDKIQKPGRLLDDHID